MSSGPFVGNPGPVLVRECGIKVGARMRITCPIRREGKCRGQAWAPHTLRRATCIWKVAYTIENMPFSREGSYIELFSLCGFPHCDRVRGRHS